MHMEEELCVCECVCQGHNRRRKMNPLGDSAIETGVERRRVNREEQVSRRREGPRC